MRLITLLNQLEEQNILSKLYQAGAATLAVYAQREVYNTYLALLATPRYADQPTRATEATAATLNVDVSTVYRARRSMEREV